MTTTTTATTTTKVMMRAAMMITSFSLVNPGSLWSLKVPRSYNKTKRRWAFDIAQSEAHPTGP